MKIKLTKKLINPIIIEGFPGFGLVGTIATEYLISHLQTELVGKIWFESQVPSLAIHQGKIIHPIELHYNKKYNLLIVHTLNIQGEEWKVADIILDIAKVTKSREIISLEGVGSPMQKPTDSSRIFYYTNKPLLEKKLTKTNTEKLNEGIIMGVTSALLMKSEVPVSAIFAETATGLPDSKAAAEVIKVLDQYLGLKIDVGPLMETAQKVEEKIKELISKSQGAHKERKEKFINYVG